MEKLKLTKREIDSLQSSGKQEWFRDATTAGLCLCVGVTGVKTWYLYKKIRGRPVKLKLGRYPEVDPAVARNLAIEASGRMAGGGDIPAERAEKQQAEITWKDLFDQYLVEHAKVHKKTWREDEANDRRYLDDWQRSRISSFTRTKIAAKHREIGESAPVAANRVLSLVHKVFEFADSVGIWHQPNPARKIKRFKEQQGTRFIHPDEMPAIVNAIREYKNKTVSDFFLTCLFTGARRANCMQMRWRDLNLKEGIWNVPMTKSGEPVSLPLAPEILSLLKDRKKSAAKNTPSEWVFPGRGRTGHLVEPKKAWASICKTAGIPDLKIHDLRRTFGSWQAAAGSSLPIIGGALGHRTTTATAVYARLNLAPIRQSVNVAVSAMLNAGKRDSAEAEQSENVPDSNSSKDTKKKQ